MSLIIEEIKEEEKEEEEEQRPSFQSIKHLEFLEKKLEFYQFQCKRYNSQKLQNVQKCIEKELETCDLDEYMIGSLQCKLIFETFEKYPVSPLTSISLKNNHLHFDCCYAMASFIKSSSKLQILNLDGCKIGDEGMKRLVHAFAISSSIISLNLSNNNLTDECGEILASFLLKNEICSELNLSRNSLGFLSARALSKVFLMENRTLKKLHLSHNRLCEAFGIVQLLEGLIANESLEYLDISWNALYGEDLGKILSKFLKGAANLKVFRIENNGLTSFELEKLALGIKFSKTIEEVYVGGNLFNAEDDENMIKVFATKSPLKLLSFGDSYHLSHEAYEALKVVRQLKPTIQVIYQNIILPNPPKEVSMLNICADRAKLLALKPKQKRLQRDMGVFMLKLKNNANNFMPKSEFLAALKEFNANLDKDLINAYIEASLVEVDGKKRLDVHLMANHYLNRHAL